LKGLGMPPRMVDDKLPTDSSVIVKMLVAGEDLVDLYAIFCPGPVRIDREFPGGDLQKLKKEIFPGSEYVNSLVDINRNLDSIIEDVKNIVLTARKVNSGEVPSYHNGFYELYRDYRHYASFADRKAFDFGGYTP